MISYIDNKFLESHEIRILSGEGELGTFAPYEGKKTVRALKLRMARERCHGDRWAVAQACVGEDYFGNKQYMPLPV